MRKEELLSLFTFGLPLFAVMKAQADDVKEVADYVTQLVRVGQGHGTWAFDKDMLEEME